MRKDNRKPFVRREDNEQHKINGKITSREVRLVMESEEPKVMATSVALKLAEEQEMDLVEISPNAVPPVCKIMDYKKFLYEKKKRDKEIKAKAVKTVIKEIYYEKINNVSKYNDKQLDSFFTDRYGLNTK
jgi:translation initiation factor IF-3